MQRTSTEATLTARWRTITPVVVPLDIEMSAESEWGRNPHGEILPSESVLWPALITDTTPGCVKAGPAALKINQ